MMYIKNKIKFDYDDSNNSIYIRRDAIEIFKNKIIKNMNYEINEFFNSNDLKIYSIKEILTQKNNN